jgi:hypothetical protein
MLEILGALKTLFKIAAVKKDFITVCLVVC